MDQSLHLSQAHKLHPLCNILTIMPVAAGYKILLMIERWRTQLFQKYVIAEKKRPGPQEPCLYSPYICIVLMTIYIYIYAHNFIASFINSLNSYNTIENLILTVSMFSDITTDSLETKL